MNHRAFVTFCLALWLVLFVRLVQAATLAESMGVYDWLSLRWALAIALLGGFLRLIYGLASDSRVITAILRESWRTALLSLLAGLAAFILIEAAKSTGASVTNEIRFTAILAAGVGGTDSLNFMIAWVKAYAVRRTNRGKL